MEQPDWLQEETERSERIVTVLFPVGFPSSIAGNPTQYEDKETQTHWQLDLQVDWKIPKRSDASPASKYLCCICCKSFVTRTQYEMHFQYNSSYQCCVCNKQFTQIVSIRRHGKVHTESWRKRHKPKFPVKSFAKVKKDTILNRDLDENRNDGKKSKKLHQK